MLIIGLEGNPFSRPELLKQEITELRELEQCEHTRKAIADREEWLEKYKDLHILEH